MDEGWLYLAVVLVLFSRRVIGWSMHETMDTELVEAALRMALQDRQPAAGVLHHADQGKPSTPHMRTLRCSTLPWHSFR